MWNILLHGIMSCPYRGKADGMVHDAGGGIGYGIVLGKGEIEEKEYEEDKYEHRLRGL